MHSAVSDNHALFGFSLSDAVLRSWKLPNLSLCFSLQNRNVRVSASGPGDSWDGYSGNEVDGEGTCVILR